MKILFCGLGSIGQRHLRNLRNLKIKCEISCFKSSKINIVLNDKNIVLKNKKIKSHYNLKHVFYDISKAIKYNPDIVLITNPSALHIKYALKFYNKKSIIFIEKPIAHNSKELNKLYLKEINQKRSFIFSGMQLRFHPIILKFKKIIDLNILGNIQGAFFLNCEYLPNWHKYEKYENSYAARKDLGGGCLLTQIHELDFVTWIFGFPKSVFSYGGKNSNLKINVEDNVSTTLFYKKNKNQFSVSVLQNFITDPPTRKFTIIGSLGTLECDLKENTLTLRLKNRKPQINKFQFNHNLLYQKQLLSLIDFVKNENKQLVTIKDSKKLINFVDIIKKSMVQKKKINLPKKIFLI